MKSARSGSFVKVPNLVDIFLPDLVPFWMVPDLVDISTESDLILLRYQGRYIFENR